MSSQLFPYQMKPSKQGWQLSNKLISTLMHIGTLSLKQPLRPWYYTGKHLHWKWMAMIDPSTYTLYIQKPHSIEVHCPVNSVYQYSHHQHPSYMPINTAPAELYFTTNTTTILPFSTLAKPPPSPNPSLTSIRFLNGNSYCLNVCNSILMHSH